MRLWVLQLLVGMGSHGQGRERIGLEFEGRGLRGGTRKAVIYVTAEIIFFHYANGNDVRLLYILCRVS